MKKYIESFAKDLKTLSKTAKCDKCAMISNSGKCTFQGEEKDKLKICNEILSKNKEIFYE